MKILVIEDKEMHRAAAKETLADHELTIVSSFDEAIEAMSTKVDYNELNRLTDEAVGELRKDATKAERSAWYAKRDELEPQVTTIPNFEVVLTDMNMPMSHATLAPGVFKREEVPYGFILALRASAIGAKYIAMVTDTNHHKGAMSAAIDHLGSAYYRGNEKPFVINGAKVLFLHTPFINDPALGVKCYNCVGGTACGYCLAPLDHEGKCSRAFGDEAHFKPCRVCNGKGTHDTTVHERKDWGKVLAHLLAS